jgi:peptidoglycan/LPS O-acetylase OafA/YrhL
MNKFYRKEIDGLRAIGILGVLIYHLEISFYDKQFLPGGYLGVDIFFVVSGYLITLLLYEEFKIKGNFSLLNFYYRRAKRLLPVLVVVIMTTTILAYFFLFPSEYSYYLKSVISSLFFVSNIFFHLTGQNYGENIISEKPLLHTWSLGVEEQFYIFFPLFLFFILKYFNKQKIFIIILIILGSLLFSINIATNHPSFNFYFLTSRIWELLLGALIVLWNKKNIKVFKNFNNDLISIIGLILIIFSFIHFNEVNKHPSVFTIIPVLGCFLILLDQNKKNFVNRILSFSILRGLGLISYSLYLWHYPILVFGKIGNFTGIENDNLINKFILVIISILLSVLTYYLIENTFRKKFKIKIKNFLFITLTIYFISILSFYMLKQNQEEQFLSISKEIKNRTWFETKQFFRPCFQRKKYFCSFNPKSEKSIFIIGDSIMASLQNELKKTLVKNDYNLITMTNAGCDFTRVFNKNDQNIFCNLNLFNERIKKIKKNKDSILILHLNYDNSGFKKDKISQDNFIKDIYKLLNLGHKIILIYPLPQMKLHVSNELSKILSLNKENSTKFLSNKENFINIDYDEFLKKSSYVNNILNKINHKKVYKLNVQNIFCNTKLKNKCIAHDDKNLFFVDNNHLSNFSSNLISKELLKIIKQIN